MGTAPAAPAWPAAVAAAPPRRNRKRSDPLNATVMQIIDRSNDFFISHYGKDDS
jgi:hypothetical protein